MKHLFFLVALLPMAAGAQSVSIQGGRVSVDAGGYGVNIQVPDAGPQHRHSDRESYRQPRDGRTPAAQAPSPLPSVSITPPPGGWQPEAPEHGRGAGNVPRDFWK